MSLEKFQTLKKQAEEYKLKVAKLKAVLDEKTKALEKAQSELPVPHEKIEEYQRQLTVKVDKNTKEITKLLSDVREVFNEFERS